VNRIKYNVYTHLFIVLPGGFEMGLLEEIFPEEN
jgi:hypothetical protein